MKKIISFSDFVDDFRSIRPDNFTYEGLEALFDYLEQLEQDTGEEIELDVIALCCEFSEYEDIEEFQRNYGDDYETIEDIEYQTTVIPVGDEGFIIADF